MLRIYGSMELRWQKSYGLANQSQLDLDRVAEANDLMSSDDEHD